MSSLRWICDGRQAWERHRAYTIAWDAWDAAPHHTLTHPPQNEWATSQNKRPIYPVKTTHLFPSYMHLILIHSKNVLSPTGSASFLEIPCHLSGSKKDPSYRFKPIIKQNGVANCKRVGHPFVSYFWLQHLQPSWIRITTPASSRNNFWRTTLGIPLRNPNSLKTDFSREISFFKPNKDHHPGGHKESGEKSRRTPHISN